AFDEGRRVTAVADVLHVRAPLFGILERLGNRGTQGPADARAHVVGRGLLGRRAHVAGRAGRRPAVVLAHAPGGLLQVELVLVRGVEYAVLGFLVDLDLRVIRPEVALAAGVRLARLRLGEIVAGVTRAARSERAIGIDPADAGVGPGVGIELAAREHFHFR